MVDHHALPMEVRLSANLFLVGPIERDFHVNIRFAKQFRWFHIQLFVGATFTREL